MRSIKEDDTIKKHRYNFVKHFDTHDKRRGTNFMETFPELKDFYNTSKKIRLKRKWISLT